MSEETHDWGDVDGELNVERCQRQGCTIRRYRLGKMWQRKKGGRWRSMAREPIPVCRGARVARAPAEEAVAIDELARRVSSAVYAAAVKHFEQAEHAGLIIGNGHHMAQDIAEKAKDLLLERHFAATLARQSAAAHRCEEECCLPK